MTLYNLLFKAYNVWKLDHSMGSPMYENPASFQFQQIFGRIISYLRWSLRMNFLPQTGQVKFFSPVWVRVWRASSSERANLFPQPAQLQGKGRSPKQKNSNITNYTNLYYTSSYNFNRFNNSEDQNIIWRLQETDSLTCTYQKAEANNNSAK